MTSQLTKELQEAHREFPNLGHDSIATALQNLHQELQKTETLIK